MTEQRATVRDVRQAAATFAAEVARMAEALQEAGWHYSDMRQAATLEDVLAGSEDAAHWADGLKSQTVIERLEGPIAARQVPVARPGTSRLRYFLDGSQRTVPIMRFGAIPVVGAVAAAAVLARDETGQTRIAPGTLRLRHTWLIPRQANHPALRELVSQIEASGGQIADPLARLSEAEYEAATSDYAVMVNAAYNQAGQLRGALENELLQEWSARPERAADDGWIVVDGRLKAIVPRAVGLVKDVAKQHLSGQDATLLFDLPPGYRTSAYRAPDSFRSVGVSDAAASGEQAPTLWYLRFRDATGLDARHALVRIEAEPSLCDTARIDELSSWLLAERAPRATADARWATLLYPIHLLEMMLKRRLEADTRGWPDAR